MPPSCRSALALWNARSMAETPSPPSPEPAWRWAASPARPAPQPLPTSTVPSSSSTSSASPTAASSWRTTRAGSCSSPTRSPASASSRARHRPAARPVLAGRDRSRCCRPRRIGSEHVWAEASVDARPGEPRRRRRVRPHPDGAAARAEGARCCATRSRAWAASSVDVEVAPGRRRRSLPASTSDGTGWRTRVRLHVAADGARRPVRGAEPHGRARGIRAPRRARARRPRAARRRGSPGRAPSTSSRPSVGDAGDRGGRRRADAARPAPDDRGARRRPHVPARPRRLLAGAPRRGRDAHRAPCRTSIDGDLFDPARRQPRPLRRGRPARRGRRRPVRRHRAHHDGRVRRARHRARGREPRRLGRCARRDGTGRPIPRRPRRAARARPSGRGCATPRSCSTRRAPAPGGQVVDRLAELRPRQLVYVACDPVALARDVGLLRERGYELDRARARSTCSRTPTTSRRWRG